MIPLTEAQFQKQVLELAETLGWHWMHIGRVGKYTANGAKGTLGTGWPDLVLIRRTTTVYAELKAQTGFLSEEQRKVHRVLADTTPHVYVWRPSDLPQIVGVLTNA